MTRERAAELLVIIEAYSEGKQIQIKENEHDEWKDVGVNFDLNFNNPNWHYRIKPQPLEGYVLIDSGGSGIFYSFEVIKRKKVNLSRERAIHVKEVTEE